MSVNGSGDWQKGRCSHSTGKYVSEPPKQSGMHTVTQVTCQSPSPKWNAHSDASYVSEPPVQSGMHTVTQVTCQSRRTKWWNAYSTQVRVRAANQEQTKGGIHAVRWYVSEPPKELLNEGMHTVRKYVSEPPNDYASP